MQIKGIVESEGVIVGRIGEICAIVERVTSVKSAWKCGVHRRIVGIVIARVIDVFDNTLASEVFCICSW